MRGPGGSQASSRLAFTMSRHVVRARVLSHCSVKGVSSRRDRQGWHLARTAGIRPTAPCGAPRPDRSTSDPPFPVIALPTSFRNPHLAWPAPYHPYLPCYGQAVVHPAGGSLSVFSLLGPWGGRHLFYPPQGLLDGRKTAGVPVSVRSTSAPGGLCRRHLRTCPSKCRAPSCIYRIGRIIWPGVLLAPGGI